MGGQSSSSTTTTTNHMSTNVNNNQKTIWNTTVDYNQHMQHNTHQNGTNVYGNWNNLDGMVNTGKQAFGLLNLNQVVVLVPQQAGYL
eukprot:CAMPEP_0170478688 /NCGR_PEP_ID=MMETSP0208-20121228/182_1 /TAXON_ID=197538 /ORGANISM="Strombidium inclinatum, Strain S3" /LENGTH=86 /DNA_ID=CAMNT_0010750985 /DNA_START=49 /DNA_END=305 /DNA_ORIENTATION=-